MEGKREGKWGFHTIKACIQDRKGVRKLIKTYTYKELISPSRYVFKSSFSFRPS